MNVYDYSFYDNSGKETHMLDYKDKTVLIVNTASRCGFTSQYEELEKFYKANKDKGFEIIAFPCHQFGAQEPGTMEEILDFCKTNFDVTFKIAEKTDVNGDTANELFKYLRYSVKGGKDISWNFEKFLILKDGSILNFSPDTTIDKFQDIIIKDMFLG